MSYSTLMLHLNPNVDNAGLLAIAADFAGRFRSNVVGVALRQAMPMVYAEGFALDDLIDQDRAATRDEVAAAKAQFEAAMAGVGGKVEWRAASTTLPLADRLALEARSADLILLGAGSDDLRGLNAGDLVLQAGRPVLRVPAGATALRLAHVMVAWKDSRETRRAVLDALPLLRQADRVSVVALAAARDLAATRDHVDDVVVWLARHAIVAQGEAVLSGGNEIAELDRTAQDQGADLVVAGAYGHSRLREWVLGGVTHDLLLHGQRCCFVSH